MDYHHPWRGMRPWKRHSIVLIVAGTIYMVIGASYIVLDPSEDTQEGLHLALLWMPIQCWGIVFVTAGTLSFISSRWPPISETWGYTVLTSLSAGWGAMYFVGVFVFDAPHSNLRGILAWGLLAFLWWAISAMVNPGDAKKLVDKLNALKIENEVLHAEIDGMKRQEE